MHFKISEAKLSGFLIIASFCWSGIQSISLAEELPSREPCRIIVVDDDNGWPVPLVELRTTHHVRFVTDNAGVIAFDLPELMNKETWLFVEGHGYSVERDRFGYHGVRVTPKRGETITIKVRRELPGKRLGRITGGGLFAESQKFRDAPDWMIDWKEQGILGCDSVQNAAHNGKLHWGWGDTVLPHYPLGRFHMIGATTSLHPLTSYKPPIRLRYEYVTGEDSAGENSTPRNIAKLPGDGPTWLSGYVSLPDRDKRNHLVAVYSKIKPPLAEYERGLCVWNDETSKFDPLMKLWERTEESSKPSAAPTGHAVIWTDENDERWVLFGDPFPTLKCRATFEGWSNPETWQTLKPQQSVPTANDSKTTIKPHRGAIAWNSYRNKWVTVFTQYGGNSSYLGELWYAEADAPTGPWANAIKVVTHNKYTVYNPQLHPEFTPEGSPILLFEATYTHTFSATKDPTPRHDYNQVLYRLDLDKVSKSGL